ncbi:methyltransferase domain-containing protein [Vibrio sp. S4M6]|uniref:methyltransferase domain-containing protein n=1 Tax=Vibrio sinus TaxID=2946865 RepID=UPI00202AAEFF|nr:methyltransferase domain-containing protein [Vibrio sinus]MCL9780126.1 methyltransferase domain-containing protein [Vibrio sinus]
MKETYTPGLGELLRHFSELLDSGAAKAYQDKSLHYRPRYTPIMRALADGKSTVSDMTDYLEITQGAVSQSLKLMIEDGLVTKEKNSDGRSSYIKLTKTGQTLLDDLQSHWHSTFTAIEQLEQEVQTPIREGLLKGIDALKSEPFNERLRRTEKRQLPLNTNSAATVKQSHFIAGGKDYATFRPSYPNPLAKALAELSQRSQRVLDVGCGTGQLSIHLADYFDEVIATDVSPDQLENASKKSNISYFHSSAESLPVTDNSVDLVVAAQAAHWFELPQFYQEAKRIAKPRAHLALISYGVPLLKGGLNAAFSRLYWQALGSHWPQERRHVENGYLDLPFPFNEIEFPEFQIQQNWDFDQLAGYIGTWSATKQAIKKGEHADLESAMSQLKSLWGDAEVKKDIYWPISVRVGQL